VALTHYQRLFDLNPKRRTGRHLSLFSFCQKDAGDSGTRSNNSSEHRPLASAGDSAEDGSNRAAAANENGRSFIALP
jgi:hypothetical protein